MIQVGSELVCEKGGMRLFCVVEGTENAVAEGLSSAKSKIAHWES